MTAILCRRCLILCLCGGVVPDEDDAAVDIVNDVGDVDNVDHDGNCVDRTVRFNNVDEKQTTDMCSD